MKEAEAARAERLAEALRLNLGRRKAQAREQAETARAAGVESPPCSPPR